MYDCVRKQCFIMGIIFILCLLGFVAANEGGPPVITEHPSNVVARRNDPATLNCAASGASRIRWYRDGEEVTTSTQDPRSHRVLLPSGSLFFLRVTATRRDSDAGTYWCVASNSYGATRSRSATLTVAILADEFQAEPQSSVKARVGEPLVLPCQPPKGSPPPELTWLRDGQEVTNSSRISVLATGDLVISQVVEEDSAVYICRARNAAGSRESDPSQVIIMTPPWFEERPANVTVASGVAVELACRARGSPAPTVTWRRLDGKMPLGRAMIEDQRLVLDHVAAADSGVYVCEVESEAGIAAARATLTVVDAPQLTQKPQDVQVVSGERAKLSCVVNGDPEPLVLWRLPDADKTALLSAGQTSGRASVDESSHTLLLQDVTTDDSGAYHCWGISNGGGVTARAELTVVSAHPPPVVGVGPEDLKLVPGTIASFPCEAVSEAATPTITWWYRPAAHLPARQLTAEGDDARISLPTNGALILKDVRADDAGIYTCHITADTGSVEQAAILRIVDKPSLQEPFLLPAPPSKPRVVAVNETAVRLTWLPNSRVSESSSQSYTVEYWRQGWEEWRVAEALIPQETCVLGNLAPGYTYTFLVRAVNKKGSSFPSPWSDPVTTRSPRDPAFSEDQLRHVRRRLSRPAVTLDDAVITAPDSVLLTWEFLPSMDEAVEGVLVYTLSERGTVQVATVLGSSSSSHLLHDLTPNTHYTIFLVPFWRSVEGTPSNSHTVFMPEDVPSTAPSDVRVTQREEGSILITWSTLPVEQARGEVIGYQVTLTHNGTQTLETVQSPWLEARGLAPGRLYTVRVAAQTGAGLGPFTAPVLMDVGSADSQTQEDERDDDASVLYAPPQPAWLVYLLIPLVLLLSMGTLIYVRRLRGKSTPANPPHAPALYQDPSLYPAHHTVNMYGEQKLWRPSESDKESSLSSTRLLRPEQLVNEYAEPRIQRANETTEPYATTALLVAPSSPRMTHAAPWRHQSDDSGVQVNWAAFLPPPPACPPPRDFDMGDPVGATDFCGGVYRVVTPSSSQYDNMGGSEQYERPCDATSEHTYDIYTQVAPVDNRGGFLTFNTLQARDHRRARSESQPPVPGDPPQSNTH
ncbi:roundabout homolog 2-like [Penaeus japonicus]|uniref:roundabout homolog 2-like n=1 Tax=Penaeus japonicus TaxID=27405 RepID=UPI001C714855|nr:roundabout homolog 2-like [Penaeus japonicus]